MEVRSTNKSFNEFPGGTLLPKCSANNPDNKLLGGTPLLKGSANNPDNKLLGGATPPTIPKRSFLVEWFRQEATKTQSAAPCTTPAEAAAPCTTPAEATAPCTTPAEAVTQHYSDSTSSVSVFQNSGYSLLMRMKRPSLPRKQCSEAASQTIVGGLSALRSKMWRGRSILARSSTLSRSPVPPAQASQAARCSWSADHLRPASSAACAGSPAPL